MLILQRGLRYTTLSAFSGSINKFFLIDCVNIYLFSIFFSIDFARWKSGITLHCLECDWSTLTCFAFAKKCKIIRYFIYPLSFCFQSKRTNRPDKVTCISAYQRVINYIFPTQYIKIHCDTFYMRRGDGTNIQKIWYS